jgi:hypothetical protein
MNTKTKSQLLTQSHGVKLAAGVEARWPSFSGVLLSIQSTSKMIANRCEENSNPANPATINGMIDYSGEVLERRLDKK